jgi:hypothetical protein
MRARQVWAAIAVTLGAFTAAGTLTGGTASAAENTIFTGPRAVSCPTASACFAVGGGDRYNRVNPVVYRRVGTHWNAAKLALPAGIFATLEAIDCPTATSCVAVGAADLTPTVFTDLPSTLIARWNGTKWQTSTSPSPLGSDLLGTRIECPVSAAMCWVVNAQSSPSVKLGVLTSAGLTEMPFALPPGWTHFSATDLSCVPKACMLVGSVESTGNGGGHGISYLLTGTFARFLLTPEPSISGVVCLTSTNCVASSYTGLAETWDGAKWTEVPLTNPPGTGPGAAIVIGCRTKTTCVGYGVHYGPKNPDVPVSDLVRIKGTTLTTARLPGNPLYPELFDGDCSPGMSSCAVVGIRTVAAPNGESVSGGVFLHFTAGHWTSES